jgi:tetratricopeptide (TPR) repeat protein
MHNQFVVAPILSCPTSERESKKFQTRGMCADPSCHPGDIPALDYDGSEDYNTCRFCLCAEDEVVHAEPYLNELHDPCPCRGSAKYVHLGCLVQHFKSRRAWQNFKCPTCQQDYTGKALQVLAQISVDHIIQEHGPHALAVTASLNVLARAEGQLGNACKSKALLEESLDILERHFGKDHIETASTLVDLAGAYGMLGDVQCQRQLLERSLALNEKHYGPDNIVTAIILNNLSTAQLGDAEKERELLERSLAIKEQHYGKGHIKIAVTLNNLAFAYGETGDLAKMRHLLERSLVIKERHFGPDHLDSCLTLANLGLACCGLRDAVAARDYIARALATCRKDSPISRLHGVVLLRAATVYCSWGEICLAESYSARAAQMLGEVLGDIAGSKVLESEKQRLRIAEHWC